MRLLKCAPAGSGFELVSFSDDLAPPYAILSHTWKDGHEVAYDELLAGTGTEKYGYAKIRFCSERASADGLEYFWVDTCCINKATNEELSTAINSMFRWYQRAAKCYVILTDVSVPEEITSPEAIPISWAQAFRHSRWFTRGWTLQELLAPASVEFFSKESKRLGSRASLEQEIHSITGIPVKALRGQRLTEFNVEERMSWAKKRTTTMKEDKVYCLLGIFEVFLPLIYGEGEEYATVRLKEEIRKRQQGCNNTNLQDLSASSLLPFPRNGLFVARESQLQSIEKSLLSSNTHQRLTIYGLGGCGKSALALEFGYRALAAYAKRLVFWVPAMSQESFELAYRDIGTHLRIPEINDENADVKQLVKEKLSRGDLGDWLMIVDNADDSQVLLGESNSSDKSARLIDCIPHSKEGSVLFTTRSRKAAIDLTQNSVLELNDMDKADAKQLFARRITTQALLDDEGAMDILLETLTGLPLAIVQAAAFINQNNTSVSDYVSLLHDAGTTAELFNERFEDPGRYRDMDSTIAKTWHISFEQIRRQDPLAAEYLSFIGCIDRIAIPLSLLPPGESAVQQTKAIGTLTGYAFITERQRPTFESSKERLFDMHRLVHMALIWWLNGHGEREKWVRVVAARAEKLLLVEGCKNHQVWKTYLPHALHTSGLLETVNGAASASLLLHIGLCQTRLGEYASAETTQRKSLLVGKKTLGPGDERAILSMQALAGTLYGQGKYKDAEVLSQQIQLQCENSLGPEHEVTLENLNTLANILCRQEKYEDAEAMQRKVLAISEKVLGRKHPNTLKHMDNLVVMLTNAAKYEDAEVLSWQTLELQEKLLQPEHPYTLTCMGNLASVLGKQSKYKEAEILMRQSLEHQEKVLGHDDPSTLNSAANLARLFVDQSRFEESLPWFERALEGFVTVYGHDHPYIASLYLEYSIVCTWLERQRQQGQQRLEEEQEQEQEQKDGEEPEEKQHQQVAFSSSTLGSDATTPTKRTFILSRGLATLGIGSSKLGKW